MRIADILSPKNLKKKETPSQNQDKKIEPPVQETKKEEPIPEKPSPRLFPKEYVEDLKKIVKIPEKPQPQIQKKVASKKAKEIYSALINCTEKLVKKILDQTQPLPRIEEIDNIIALSMESLEIEPEKLLSFFERSTLENYIIAHIVNVTILSIATSKELGWGKDRQYTVGLGAWLHDTGLILYKDLYSKKEELSPEEKKSLQDFPLMSLSILKEFLDKLSLERRAIIKNIILQTQEKNLGEGYPFQLVKSRISKEAQLVRLCDIYEAITHPRPYRDRELPNRALRDLVTLSGETFDGELIKALWGALTLFPPGTYLKLSTGEIAQVIGLNKKSPTHPIVKVIIREDGRAAKENMIIDLSEQNEIQIKEAIDECRLKMRDIKLALKIKAQKWWLK
ncbi:MAG: HD domain-containing protein [Elusimicrobia bacterium]|nr:HD domain-containing protein [Elusimicrobiota bacterium]